MKEYNYGRLDQNKKVIPSNNIETLSGLFGSEKGLQERTVARTEVHGGVVSTVFLGINHGWSGKDLWFESMFFANKSNHELDEHCERYETYEEALAGHKFMVSKFEELK